ncbi:MAG: DUF4355 domain-containing protein [Bacilli bacterium]|nr:DUF4355 domain-containing protein [Bacilli bacterium]
MEDNKDKDVDVNKDKDNKDTDNITITQAELDKKIQQAVITNSQNEKKKYEKELQRQKSLIGLDAQELLKAEKADLESQLTELQMTNLKYETIKVLSNKGLNTGFVDFVVGSDAETTQANIDKLDKLFKAEVLKEVTKRVSSTGTKNSNNSSSGAITKEQFRKMSIAEQTNLFNTDKELYIQLSK